MVTIVLGVGQKAEREDAAEIGLTPAQLAGLPAFVVMNLLENESTKAATALLPFMVTVTEGAAPLASPEKLVKAKLKAGVAVSVTTVPSK